MKLLAFACGASFAGTVGVLFSAKQIFINPESFTFMESIGVLAMIILGGMGSIPGAILGASVVTILNLQILKGLSLWLNELRNAGTVILGYDLTNLPTQLEPAKYERMIFGLILVLMMIFRPQGILPGQASPSRARGGALMALLEARGVSKRFGGLTALNAVDFTLEEGHIASIIGPNAAPATSSSAPSPRTASPGATRRSGLASSEIEHWRRAATRATLTAKDTAGNVSKVRRLSFTIVAR